MQRTLPAELVKFILELCAEGTLKDASLASRQFRDIAQPIVFRTIFVRVRVLRPAGEAYQKAMFLQGSPHIVKFIRVVRIWIGSESHITPANTIIAQLRHKGVEELELDIAPSVQTTRTFDDFIIKMCKSSRMQRIALRNYSRSRILSSLRPSLKDLKVCLWPLEDASRWPRPRRTDPIVLESLCMVWEPPAPSPYVGQDPPQFLQAVPQLLHFLDKDRSKFDLSRLKYLQIPIHIGIWTEKVNHGVSECRAVLSQCQDTLERLSLIMEWELSTDLPPLDAWDTVSLDIGNLPRLQIFEIKVTGWMEHALHWVYAQLRAASCTNIPFDTLTISITNRDVIRTQRPYTAVWHRLDVMLADRQLFPHLRVMNIFLEEPISRWRLPLRDITQAVLSRKLYVCVDESDRNTYARANFLEKSPHIAQLVRVIQIWAASGPRHFSLRYKTVLEFDLGAAHNVICSGPFEDLVIKMCRSLCQQKLTLQNYPPSHALASLQPSLSHLAIGLEPQQDSAEWAQPERSPCATLESLGFVWDRKPPDPIPRMVLKVVQQTSKKYGHK
ncbi:hypothetical protein BKA70DRAFT_1573296 [Coprinopsis sp. MPI-PUGE-AT-0042]|nr:hypothetical protein BKA70DRAFT_1573296 [Coprinopsis sp. MPI-PUGE-AT-0042]